MKLLLVLNLLLFSHLGFAADLPFRVFAYGQWNDNFETESENPDSRTWNANVWIDFLVKNVAFQKKVGVRWTTDGWKTYQDNMAKYEGPIGFDLEKWTVDILAMTKSLCEGCEPSTHTFEFATFYIVDGKTYWDNNMGENYKVTL